MSQKVIRIGSSLGVTLPKRLLNKLGLKISDEVELEYNSRREAIEILPLKPKQLSEDSLFSEVKELIDSHRAEFEKIDD